MSSTSKADYFGSFLGSVNAATGVSAPESAPASNAPIQKRLLSALAAQIGPVSVKDLMYQLDLSPSLVVHALQELQEARLVTLLTIGNDEQAAMTDLGRRLAS